MTLRRLGCALCVGLLGCGSDLIEHAPEEPELGPTTGFASFGGEVGEVTSGPDGDGNFPEPALTRCGELGDGIYPIANLRAAWAVAAVGGTEDDDGEVEPGTLRLRLSDQPLLDCQDRLDVSGWGLALTLTPSETMLGERELASLHEPELELVQDGEPSNVPMTGTIELLRVTQDCVVGVLSRLEIDGAPAPAQSGAFVAEVCARDCLPTNGRSC